MRRALPLLLTDLASGLAHGDAARCIGCGERAALELCPRCLRQADVGNRFRDLADRGAHRLGLYGVRRGRSDRGTTALAAALATFKYGGRRDVGRRLARLFARFAPTLPGGYDLLVPVPLHPRRLRHRGFNQSGWLAGGASRSMRLPLRAQALHRVLDDEAQAARSGDERRRLARATFVARRRVVAGASVLLIDDVLTTGTTAVAAADALHRAGARRVDIAVLLVAQAPRAARTQLEDERS